MNIKWLSPTSPFNVSYLRRLYVLGLLVIVVWSAPDMVVGTPSWKLSLLGFLVVASFFGFLTRVSMLALVLVCVSVLKLPPFSNSIIDYYLDLGLILAASRSSDVLSFDASVQSRSRADKGVVDAPRASVVYAVPIRLIWLFGGLSLALSRPTDMMAASIFAGICLMSLVDWSRHFRRWGRRIFIKPMYVIYDGNCKLCRRTAAGLNAMDEFGRLTYVNGINDAELKRYSLTHLDKTRLAQDIHVVSNGRVFVGFFGYREMAKRIPILWMTVPFLYLWPIPQIAQAVYRKIADSRGCSVIKSKPLHWVDSPLKPADLIAPAVVAALLLIGHVIRL